METEILRCHVRVLVGDGYGRCAAEATHFAIVRLGQRRPDEDTEDYAILLCEKHAGGSPDAEAIGLKSIPELRDHIRYLEAEPGF